MSTTDPTDYRSTEAQQQQARERAEKLAEMDGADWAWLMAQKRGRRLVWRLLGQTGLFRTSFTGNNETFFKEGKRHIGLEIVQKITAYAAEDYAKMFAESGTYDK